MSLGRALDAISPNRAASLTLDLVRIASPTGDTVAVSHRLAEELTSLGCEVQLHTRYPATPVVIGRLRGSGDGPTLILNGHLDTVPIPHPEPVIENGRVYGRGTIDMKGPIAAAVEAMRAARDTGLGFRGDVVLCAHGLHEAPGGHAEDLIAALEDRTLQGDAAIVLEVGHDALPLVGLGSGIYRARFFRPQPVTHELMTPPGTANPLFAAAEGALVIRELNVRLSQTSFPYAGPASAFLGQLHGGDFFNRFANEAWIEGTRRYGPDQTAEEVGGELRALLEPIAARSGLELDFVFERVRDGFRIDPEHPLVRALRSAFLADSGHELPVTGIRIVADVPVFEKVGGIPALYHGLDGQGAHGDLESVAIDELGRGARVYLRTLAEYLGTS